MRSLLSRIKAFSNCWMRSPSICLPLWMFRPYLVSTPTRRKKKPARPIPKEPVSALAFKIMTDPFVGQLAFFRVYSGELTSGSYIYNSTKNVRERIGRLLRMHSNKREEVKSVGAGDIAAAIGFKKTFTGDTLCPEDKPVVLEAISFPNPLFPWPSNPNPNPSRTNFPIVSLNSSRKIPPSKLKSIPKPTRPLFPEWANSIWRFWWIACGVSFHWMSTSPSLRSRSGKPLPRQVEHDYKYVKQSGGRGQYGHVEIFVEPREAGEGFEFVNKIVGGSIPREYIPAVQKGIEEAMDRGILCGFSVVDVRVTLKDGSYHEVDSSEMAFKICASIAFQEACKKASPVLLEPIMEVEVVTPEEFMGDVIGNLNSKRGKVKELSDRAGAKVIRAEVPLAGMFGYSTDLRSATQGRANYSMEFSKYDVVPNSIAEELIAKSKGTSSEVPA